MQAKATSKFERTAPNKLRQVAGQIRGLPVEQARRLLQVSPKDAAVPLRKTLDSAVANAEHNHDLDPDELVVAEIMVNEGPTLRRFRPRAMGRATRIRKRTSHLTVRVGLPVEQRPQAATTNAPTSGAGAGRDEQE